MTEDTIYRIAFMCRAEVYEIFAKHVTQGSLFGFVEVEGLLFGERTKILIDSSEERLKNEFQGVTRTYIPLHAVLRIDEVDKAGRGRISAGDGKVASFPMTIVPPRGEGSDT